MRQCKVRFCSAALDRPFHVLQRNTWPIISGAVFAIALVGSSASAAPPERSGLTTILSGGFGYTRIIQAQDDSFGSLILGPVSASVGGFMTRNWSLQLRAGTHWFANDDERNRKRWFSNIFLGSELQHWIRDNVAVSAGAGLSVVVTEPIEINADRGVSLSIRGAWAFKTTKRNAFSIAWEIRPSVFLNNEVILDSLVLLQWQRL